MMMQYLRAQDPNEGEIPHSFHCKKFAELPAVNKYKKGEMGSDTNKGLKKRVRGEEFYDFFLPCTLEHSSCLSNVVTPSLVSRFSTINPAMRSCHSISLEILL